MTNEPTKPNHEALSQRTRDLPARGNADVSSADPARTRILPRIGPSWPARDRDGVPTSMDVTSWPEKEPAFLTAVLRSLRRI